MAQSRSRIWFLDSHLGGDDGHSQIATKFSDGPEEIGRLVGAYQQTLRALRLTDRRDRITELVAAKVFEIGQTGVGDAAEISRLVIKAL
jgi:hypothetical protein